MEKDSFLLVRRLPFLSAGAVFFTAFLVPLDATMVLVRRQRYNEVYAETRVLGIYTSLLCKTP